MHLPRLFAELLNDCAEDVAKKIFGSLMEWDHISPELKNKCVSLIRDKILRAEEIDLCQLLCLLCHRIKTWTERGSVDHLTKEQQRKRWSHRKHIDVLLEEKWDRLNSAGMTCQNPNCRHQDVIEHCKSECGDLNNRDQRKKFTLMFDWAHIDPWNYFTNQVARIRDVELRAKEMNGVGEIVNGVPESGKGGCLLYCFICHRKQTVDRKEWHCTSVISLDPLDEEGNIDDSVFDPESKETLTTVDSLDWQDNFL